MFFFNSKINHFHFQLFFRFISLHSTSYHLVRFITFGSLSIFSASIITFGLSAPFHHPSVYFITSFFINLLIWILWRHYSVYFRLILTILRFGSLLSASFYHFSIWFSTFDSFSSTYSLSHYFSVHFITFDFIFYHIGSVITFGSLSLFFVNLFLAPFHHPSVYFNSFLFFIFFYPFHQPFFVQQ